MPADERNAARRERQQVLLHLARVDADEDRAVRLQCERRGNGLAAAFSGSVRIVDTRIPTDRVGGFLDAFRDAQHAAVTQILADDRDARARHRRRPGLRAAPMRRRFARAIHGALHRGEVERGVGCRAMSGLRRALSAHGTHAQAAEHEQRGREPKA
ncbi:hypothetical protein QF025_005292 [Paraburkholderia graminis]|uniref:Uncharacterized protein n=1 Tax=Paraburkholderia graminis TaxID=60548 RepID=A0ABD5CRT5_9BURK|nr:hypothetical protein [Paraburkholderia graminis]